jgi:hypothetical protein
MKTQKNKFGTKKLHGNPFDRALIRLGQHFLPQQPATLSETQVKKS